MKRLILCICTIALLFSACGFQGTDGEPAGAVAEETAENQASSPSPALPPADEEDGPGTMDPGSSDSPEHSDSNTTAESGQDATPAGSAEVDEVPEPQLSFGPGNADGSVHTSPAVKGDIEQADGGESRTDTHAADPVSVPENVLKGKIICIDPGHGNPGVSIPYEKIAPGSNETKPGFAYGTTGVSTKIPEYVLNMEVSLKLRTALEARGCVVVMTRESNEENLGNIERAQIGNDAGSDLVIRVHADGSDNPDVRGVSVLYPGNRYISDETLLKKSKSAAQYILDAVVQVTGAKSRGIVKRDDLTGFNWTTRPTILIEMGFMTNPEEDKLLQQSRIPGQDCCRYYPGAHRLFFGFPGIGVFLKSGHTGRTI